MKVYTITKRVNVPAPFRINDVSVKISNWPCVFLAKEDAFAVPARDQTRIASYMGRLVRAVRFEKTSKGVWTARAGSTTYTITRCVVKGEL